MFEEKPETEEIQVVDAKEFTIQNLKRIIEEKEQEILRLTRERECIRYYATLGHERLMKALTGELEKPILRSIEGDESD